MQKHCDSRRKVIIGKAQTHFVAKHGAIIAEEVVLRRHFMEQRLHGPFCRFKCCNQTVECTGIRLAVFPIFFAFIAQIVFDFVPSLREDGADLYFVSASDVWRKFLREFMAEIIDQGFRNTQREV